MEKSRTCGKRDRRQGERKKKGREGEVSSRLLAILPFALEGRWIRETNHITFELDGKRAYRAGGEFQV